MGDYFANTITRDGEAVISVSDTRQDGAVALPLVIRQVGGPTVGDPYAGTLLDVERHGRPPDADDTDPPRRGAQPPGR